MRNVGTCPTVFPEEKNLNQLHLFLPRASSCGWFIKFLSRRCWSPFLCTYPLKSWNLAKSISSTMTWLCTTSSWTPGSSVGPSTSPRTWGRSSTCSLIRRELWPRTRWCSGAAVSTGSNILTRKMVRSAIMAALTSINPHQRQMSRAEKLSEWWDGFLIQTWMCCIKSNHHWWSQFSISFTSKQTCVSATPPLSLDTPPAPPPVLSSSAQWQHLVRFDRNFRLWQTKNPSLFKLHNIK